MTVWRHHSTTPSLPFSKSMFDPNLPQENTVADAAQMRSQFNGLKALIDAMSSITAAQVDGVNTLPAGSAAQVNVNVSGNTLHFSFSIPQGNDGPTGATGQPGEVTQTDLNNGLLHNLSQCSNNSNGVSTLGQGADSSYNPGQMQDLINKVDELINALRR